MPYRPKLSLEVLSQDHLFHISCWGVHEDPLLWEYNISDMCLAEAMAWFQDRRPGPFKVYYAVMEGDEMVGYFGFKKVNRILGRAELGLALDPDKTSQGYGSRIMDLALDLFFLDMGMESLSLEVDDFNSRARGLYEKFSFKEYGKALSPFKIEDQDLVEGKARGHFIYRWGRLYSKTSKMKLGKEDYNEVRLKRGQA